MALVKSLEHLTIDIPAGTASVTTDLGEGQDMDYCVPFITYRATSPTGDQDALDQYFVDASFVSGTPDKLKVETTNSSGRVLVVEAWVVEFESSEVNVYTDSVTLSGVANTTIDISTAHGSTVTVANTFVITTGRPTGSAAFDNESVLRTELVDGDSLWIGRRTTTGGAVAHYWIVEATAGAFTVQHVNATIASATSSITKTAPTDFTAVADLDKTLMIGTWNGYNSNSDNDRHPYIELVDDSTISCVRKGTSEGNDITVMLVEFDSGGGESVQRGKLEQTTPGSPNTDTITTAVDLNIAMPYICHSGFRMGNFPGNVSADVADSFVGVDLASATSIRFQHSTGGGDSGNFIPWEVIEWDITGYTPPVSSRRVMVIS